MAVLAETLSYENYRGFPHVQNQRHNRQTYQPIECNVNQEQHIQSFNEFDLFWLNLSNECNLISVQYIWHLIQFDGVCVCTLVQWAQLCCLQHFIQIWYKLTSICVGKLQFPVQTQPIHEQENSSAVRSSFVNQRRTCSHQQFNNLTSQKKMICTSISFIYTKFVSS